MAQCFCMKKPISLLCAVFAFSAAAKVTWFAVDPMGETPYLPDTPPADGLEGAPVRVVAARGEYEPGSFVLVSDEDLGKVRFVVGDLRTSDGKVFPAKRLDLKTVKVWYQAGNAWTSYFEDPGLKLCPELLLNDEDLVLVDRKKGWNYARLTEADGTVSYRWLNPPRDVDTRTEDAPGFRLDDSFLCMKPNFRDAETHCGATLSKGEYKQFFLTADVTGDVAPGLYRGEVKVGGSASVPVVLRVLDFDLPAPKCYFDVEKDFATWFCEYVGIDHILPVNGNDRALAERQLLAILRDFVRHGEVLPSYRDRIARADLGLEAGMCFTNHLMAGSMLLGQKAEMRYDARRKRERLERRFGPAPKYLSWGDEFGLATLRGVREMIEIYQKEGFLFPVNSRVGYEAGGYLADLFWPPVRPDGSSAKEAFRYNQLGDGYFGWYASQHVGVENPAFCRRQYGFGPYRAGLSCSSNYAHHLQGWNDRGHNLYRPMMLVYGAGHGCIDTIAWEGFREGLDDIRYATKLLQLAKPLARSKDVKARYAAKKALQLLADADGDDMDLTTLRLEMIRHIETLRSL